MRNIFGGSNTEHRWGCLRVSCLSCTHHHIISSSSFIASLDQLFRFYCNFCLLQEEHLVYIKRVVARISYNSQRLYDLGLQDVMVYNLVPPNFTPHYTQKYNYSICDTSVDPSAQIHNGLLLSAVEKINTRNPGTHFIILDQYLAFG